MPMHYSPKLILLLLTAFLLQIIHGQERKTGPVITDYGAVFTVPAPDFKTDTTATFKVVFDIMYSPEDPGALNRSIETAARFLNMHAQQGVSPSQMKVALVFHNLASKDLLSNKAYRKRYQQNNPNADLVASLRDANAAIILCGQSAASRNIPPKDQIEGVQMALSAMTALIQLQQDDYTLIKF